MRRIFQLPDYIVAQIAAGEVIERPAYAVKELLENALDAHASDIQLFIEDAGLKKIMIVDNGDGMSPEDVDECYKHHTTSKLTPESSLVGITSFGFRGEALSSLASASTLTIKSKTKESKLGKMIQVQKGKKVKEFAAGMSQGTTIVIDHLFSALPARKKFMSSTRTEFRLIADMVLQMALAHPEVRLQLFHNNRMVFDYIKEKNSDERIQSFLGKDIYQQLIPVAYENAHVTITGFLSKPHLTTNSTNKQYLFVNNRSVSDKVISQRIKEAYGTLLDKRSYPIFVLFLSLPHDMVDVNIHPRKEHVSFINPVSMTHHISTAVEETISRNNLLFSADIWGQRKYDAMPRHATNILRDVVLSSANTRNEELIHAAEVMQVHNLYIILPTQNGIVLIDQHAAHERILFEAFLKAYGKQKKPVKRLALKETLILSISSQEARAFDEYKKQFDNLGFSLEQFGKEALKVTHVPTFFKDHDLTLLVTEMIHEHMKGSSVERIDRQSEKMITYLACRNAIKAGEKLTKKQCGELLEKLRETPNNYTCPHGRPVRIVVPLRDINKIFKRE